MDDPSRYVPLPDWSWNGLEAAIDSWDDVDAAWPTWADVEQGTP
jgi:hypothetical protein